MKLFLAKCSWTVLLIVLFALTAFAVRASLTWVAGLRLALIATTAIVVWRSSPTSLVSVDFVDWFLCLFAAIVPLLLVETTTNYPVGMIVAMLGVLVAALSLVELDRSFGILPGGRSIKVLGPYRVVRHPLYLGYLLATFGWAMYAPSVRNGALFVVLLAAQVTRICREEAFLMKNCPDYCAYCRNTRFRLLPWIY